MKSQDTVKSFSQKPFTTKPKIRRLTWHKQQTVRNRVYALQESFYPTKDVSYNAVKVRMASLLGIVDRSSVLAYLGRPKYEKHQEIDQTVHYIAASSRVRKRHRFTHKLPAKKGYIELFGLGYVYSVKSVWFIHWSHVEQLTLSQSEGSKQGSSIVDFSLSCGTREVGEKAHLETHVSHVVERQRRESVSKGERNCESESNQGFSIQQHRG